MHKGFLIIGLTGPLYSGCSTVANFLESGLSHYAEELRSKRSDVDVLIGKYYRYLRESLGDDEKKESKYTEAQNNLFLEPEKLIMVLHDYGNKEKVMYHKLLNRRLRQLIQQRDLINAFLNGDWPTFKIISLSDMIVKITISNLLNPSEGYSDNIWNNTGLTEPAIEELKRVANKHKGTIDKYDSLFNLGNRNNANYNEIKVDFCRDVDNVFLEIHEAKEKIKNMTTVSDQWLQNLGDNLRGTGDSFKTIDQENKFHLDIIAEEANKYIKYLRKRKDEAKCSHFVLDCLRNPEEVLFFRKRYGSFYLISLYAGKKIRHKRCQEKGKSWSDKQEKRDQGKGNKVEDIHKQNVPGCVLISDYAITNELDNNRLKLRTVRLLALIHEPGCLLPTAEETYMNLAYTLSVRSTCISRQVGAVITNSDGFIIGAGWNDVGSGQLGCSTRCIDDYRKYKDDDCLLSIWRDEFDSFEDKELLRKMDNKNYLCYKDLKSTILIHERIDKLFSQYKNNLEIGNKERLEDEQEKKLNDFADYLKKNLNIKRLEYARSLHAEENAILQVATHGGVGIKGGTIYTTTFPCELCAKKIYQSGITRVVYTEPYPESISEKIFLKDGIRSIRVEQFEGVKSNCYYRLFKSRTDQKDLQKVDKLLEN